jgi:hypothetical protein
MSTDLNRRDIELLLMILEDVEQAALDCSGKSPYAMEELMLYDKLEKMLAMMETHDAHITTSPSTLTH